MFFQAVNFNWPLFIFASLGILGAIIQGIDEKLDLSAEYARYDETRKSFMGIPRKIQLELRKVPSHRKDADDFADLMEDEIATIQKDAPFPLEKYVRRWVEMREKYRYRKLTTVSQIEIYQQQQSLMGNTISPRDAGKVMRDEGRSGEHTRAHHHHHHPRQNEAEERTKEPAILVPIEASAPSTSHTEPVEKASIESVELDSARAGRERFVGGRDLRRDMFRIESTYRDVLHRGPAVLPNRLPHKVIASEPEEVPHLDPVGYLKSIYTKRMEV